MASTVKFDIPASARSFHPFSRLPPEIRHQIWEDAVLEPGMHFIRLKTAARVAHLPSPLVTSTIDENDEEHSNPILDFSREKLPSKLWPATLEPRYPTPQANLSNYVALNRTLAKLSVTCFESAAVIQRLVNQPGSVKLNGGRVVSLASSEDVVCLEYLSADNFRSWCRMSINIDCPELANIRHVAIPYCHGWEATSTAFGCSHCGDQHHAGVSKVYPVHLYEFLARYLPNLQTFYFIDYLIVKKSFGPNPTAQKSGEIIPSSPQALTKTQASAADKSDKRKKEDALDDNPSPNKTVDSAKAAHSESTTAATTEATQSSTSSRKRIPEKAFRSEGRIFRELAEDEWTIKSRVVDTLSWIQKRFSLYAARSKLSKHVHPENVKFKILACEWVEKQSEAPRKSKRTVSTANEPLRKRLRPLSERSREWSTPIEPAPKHSTTHSFSALSIRTSTNLEGNFYFVFGRDSHSAFDFCAGSTLDVGNDAEYGRG
ncbi:hypothetical protein CT0861_07220 [Colletotrichum tofieldiae]|uniref:2EXR domain-containing protein n=1 Tax=Colletotrichum tofieldiae TaxID=708197 RepID=A0A166XNW1_9PEZI|nr:hypothetical protein CT0861_07220 [Colletotrichum tofieldiae]